MEIQEQEKRRASNLIWNAAQDYDFEPDFKAYDEEGQADLYWNCIVGAVRFGASELSDTPIFTGYRWPVQECFRLNAPIRNIRGKQGLWRITF